MVITAATKEMEWSGASAKDRAGSKVSFSHCSIATDLLSGLRQVNCTQTPGPFMKCLLLPLPSLE